MMMVLKVERFTEAWPDAQELLKLHWLEVARDRDTIELSPAVQAYEHLDKIGQLLIVTMRIEGKLVGYHCSFVKPHLHYSKSLTAYTDIYFIHPQFRKGRNAMKLFQFVEDEMRARGVDRMFSSCKLTLDMTPLFQHLGWTHIENNFSKRLVP